eukprot:355739-Chlamydomonas_euryale.AAC.3
MRTLKRVRLAIAIELCKWGPGCVDRQQSRPSPIGQVPGCRQRPSSTREFSPTLTSHLPQPLPPPRMHAHTHTHLDDERMADGGEQRHLQRVLHCLPLVLPRVHDLDRRDRPLPRAHVHHAKTALAQHLSQHQLLHPLICLALRGRAPDLVLQHFEHCLRAVALGHDRPRRHDGAKAIVH